MNVEIVPVRSRADQHIYQSYIRAFWRIERTQSSWLWTVWMLYLSPQLARKHLIYIDNRPIGTVLLTMYLSQVLYIANLFIAADERGKGYGKETLMQLEATARSTDKKRLLLCAEKHLHAMYQQQGFRRIWGKFFVKCI